MTLIEKNKLFSKYYEKHKDEVYTYIYYRCGRDQMLAEDVAQAAFLKAFDRFQRFDDTYSFRTWIFTIVKNTLTDLYRKKKEIPLAPDELPETPTDESVFMDVLDKEYDMKMIEECMNELSPKQKQCVEDRFFVGVSTKNIATNKQMTLDAVEKNITRGLHSVRDCVKNNIRKQS